MSKTKNRDRDSFNVLDVVRIVGGLLLMNAFFSWWFTSTSTWGYDGKWINTGYLQFRLTNGYVNLTQDELSKYNGVNPKLPIYVGVNGSVYDVSASPSIYGPSGMYAKLSGKDCARIYITGCFGKEDEYTHDLRGLDVEEADNDISGWQKFYENHRKYWYVGQVQLQEVKTKIPEPCEHVKAPGYYDHKKSQNKH